VTAWRLWNAQATTPSLIRRLQGRKCAQTGARLWKTSEVDHQVPLFKSGASIATWRGGAARVLGLPNLQIINRDVHVHKCGRRGDVSAAHR